MHDEGLDRGPQARPKGFRHGFGVHAIRSGIPITLVQRWLGQVGKNASLGVEKPVSVGRGVWRPHK